MTDILTQFKVNDNLANVLARCKLAAGELHLQIHDELNDGFRAGSEWWGAYQITIKVTSLGRESIVAIDASSVKIGYGRQLWEATQRFIDLVVVSPSSLQQKLETSQSIEDRQAFREKILSDIENRFEREKPEPVTEILALYPLEKHGPLIGTPGHGTHQRGASPDNWQSDNAVDIKVPKGTPVVAVEDGKIGNRIGPLNSSNPRMAGLRVYVENNHNSFYYAHLSRLVVSAGESVKKGQVIGYSGEANGVAHLHFAQHRGDPRGTINKK